ncbi:hypothetical protein CONLIGDRAFT_635573 [Coniochaeta ligniaria NRRL 30616]|uniref:Uncharacterized protein n=1 Tax=Coniochaeta ligniaria NRRL 30616 TaxID=1408157 RepID=A0A1J7J9E4_9PEZI|nr:hypothetical protein CONLIGDRAFT_635573 [Coniochaeta ligniaria NRRL 30616]
MSKSEVFTGRCEHGPPRTRLLTIFVAGTYLLCTFVRVFLLCPWSERFLSVRQTSFEHFLILTLVNLNLFSQLVFRQHCPLPVPAFAFDHPLKSSFDLGYLEQHHSTLQLERAGILHGHNSCVLIARQPSTASRACPLGCYRSSSVQSWSCIQAWGVLLSHINTSPDTLQGRTAQVYCFLLSTWPSVHRCAFP